MIGGTAKKPMSVLYITAVDLAVGASLITTASASRFSERIITQYFCAISR